MIALISLSIAFVFGVLIGVLVGVIVIMLALSDWEVDPCKTEDNEVSL